MVRTCLGLAQQLTSANPTTTFLPSYRSSYSHLVWQLALPFVLSPHSGSVCPSCVSSEHRTNGSLRLRHRRGIVNVISSCAFHIQRRLTSLHFRRDKTLRILRIWHNHLLRGSQCRHDSSSSSIGPTLAFLSVPRSRTSTTHGRAPSILDPSYIYGHRASQRYKK